MDNEPPVPSETITIVTTAPPKKISGSRSTPSAPIQEVRQRVEVPIDLETVRTNFDRFLASLQKIVDVKRAQVGEFVLDEITFSAEISGTGEFKLFGSGVGVTATNAVTFTLRRKETEH